MPRLDGHTAARQILAEAGDEPPAFILLTASVEQEQLMPLGLPQSRLLPKPFAEGALLAAIAELLGLRYEYGAAPATRGVGETRHGELTAADLGALPMPLRDRLVSALIGGNPEEIAAAVAAIELDSPGLRTAVAALVEEFAYRQLLELLDAARALSKPLA